MNFPYLTKDQLVTWGFPAYAPSQPRPLPTWQRYHGLQGMEHAMISGQYRGSIAAGELGRMDMVWERPFDQLGLLRGQALAMGMARGGSSYDEAGMVGARMAGLSGLGASQAGTRACNVTGGLLNFGSEIASLFSSTGDAPETAAEKQERLQRQQRGETASGALKAGAGLTETICNAVDATDPAATSDPTADAVFGTGPSAAPAPRTEEAGLSTNTLLLGAIGIAGVIALVAFLRN